MQVPLKALLIANTVFEGAIGMIMLFASQVFFKGGNELTVAVARSFGFAALAIATLSLTMLLTKNDNSRHGLITLAVFHIGLTISQAINFQQNIAPLPVVLIHLIFAILFISANFLARKAY